MNISLIAKILIIWGTSELLVILFLLIKYHRNKGE